MIPQKGDSSIEVRLYEPFQVQGRVIDSEGNAVPGADVTARVNLWIIAAENDWYRSLETESSEDGTFQFERAPPAEERLYGRREQDLILRGFSEQRLEELQSAANDVVIVLEPSSYVISGTLHSPTGEPLAGERLAAYSPGSSREDDELNGTTTDADGHFVLWTPIVETVELHLVTAGRRMRLTEPLALPTGPQHLVAEPTPHHEFQVLALDPEGKPIPHFEVEAFEGGEDLYPNWEAEKGMARVRIPKDGVTWFRINHPRDRHGTDINLAPVGFQAKSDMPREVTVRFAKHALFFGSVRDQDEKPVAGVALHLADDDVQTTVVTDERGEWSYTTACTDTHEIFLEKLTLPPGYRDVSEYYSDELPAGQPLDIRVRKGPVSLRAQLEVPGEPGADLSRLSVHAHWSSAEDVLEERYLELKPDKHGRVEIIALPEDAEITLTIDRSELDDLGLIAEQQSVTVPAGTLDLRLVLNRGLELRGTLAGPGLKDLNLDDLEVRVLSRYGHPIRSHPCDGPRTGAPTFVLKGLEDGPHDLALVANHGLRVVTIVRGVRAGDENIVFQVPRADGSIRGSVQLKDPSGAPRIVGHVWNETSNHFVRALKIDREGGFEVHGLDMESSYTIEVSEGVGPDVFVARERGVRTGSTLTMTLQDDLEIRVRIEGAYPVDRLGYVVAWQGSTLVTAYVYDIENEFTLDGLFEGDYAVFVTREDFTVLGDQLKVRAGHKGTVVLKVR